MNQTCTSLLKKSNDLASSVAFLALSWTGELSKLSYCEHVCEEVQHGIIRQVTPVTITEHSGVSLNVH